MSWGPGGEGRAADDQRRHGDQRLAGSPGTTEPEYMSTTAVHPDVMTLPTASIRLGVSLDRLRELLRKDADLAARIGKVGGRWCIDANGLELIRQAVTERTR